MRMRLLAAGTRMPGWIEAGFADYAGRLRGDYRLELLEIPLGERGGGDVRRAVEAEGRRMLAAAGERGHLVALQVAGRALTTEQLARWLEERFDRVNPFPFRRGRASTAFDRFTIITRRWKASIRASERAFIFTD